MFSNPKAKIYDLLDKHSDLVVKASLILGKLCHNWSRLSNYADELAKVEHEADKLVDEITDDVEKKFILPLDKEDVKSLAEKLDDIIDDIESFANRCVIYKLQKSYEGMEDFVAIIHEATQKIDRGVTMLARQEFDREEFIDLYRKIRQLEKQGDRHYRKILAKVMKNPDVSATPAQIWEMIKWREMWNRLENILDKCESVAVLFEIYRIKYE